MNEPFNVRFTLTIATIHSITKNPDEMQPGKAQLFMSVLQDLRISIRIEQEFRCPILRIFLALIAFVDEGFIMKLIKAGCKYNALMRQFSMYFAADSHD